MFGQQTLMMFLEARLLFKECSSVGWEARTFQRPEAQTGTTRLLLARFHRLATFSKIRSKTHIMLSGFRSNAALTTEAGWEDG